MERINVSGNSPYEALVGFSRAVRIGNVVHIAGTVATGEDGAVVGRSDPYAQTIQTLENIARALEKAGASLSDVVRTRMYVTDITNWEPVARAHGEFFSEIRPASTMVEVSRLIDPAMLIEIEAEALLD